MAHEFKEISPNASGGAKLTNWFENRFPTAFDAYRVHMSEYYAPKNFNFWYFFGVLSMVVLGGMGHIPGVILGAVLLTITPEILRDVIGPLQMAVFGKMLIDPENARMLIFGLALILVMLFRPEGLWPSKRRAAEFHDALDEDLPAVDSQASDGLKG